MEVKDIAIKYKRSDSEFKIFAIGDIHAGTIHCVEDEIKRKINEVKNTKNAYWLGMGDMAEWITPTDKRFDPSQRSIAEWVQIDDITDPQEKFIIKLFEPIKDRCLGLLYGNHENSIRMYHHENVHQHICDALNVSNLGYSCFLRLYFRRDNSTESHLVKGCFTHGSSSAITEGAKMMALIRWMKQNEADIYGYAHLHDYLEKYISRLTVKDSKDGGRIKSSVSVGCVTGSWFRTYTQGIEASYGERKSFPPTEICCAVYTIDPENGIINVDRSP